MINTDIIRALFRPVHIQNDPVDELRQYTDDQRQRQKELISDLIAEQLEQM